VFLDDLPRWDEDSKYKGKINWKESVGQKVKFIYDDMEGYLEILDYEDKKLTLRYINNLKQVLTDSLIRCNIGKLIGIKVSRKEGYKFEIGDVVSASTSDLKIIEQMRVGKSKRKAYLYECVNCGNMDSIGEYELNKHGCNVCCSPSRKILKGYNDLWTTHPEVVRQLKYSEIGFEVSKGSHRKEIFICDNCGFEDRKTISNVVKQGVSCLKCGDGVSYPEKYISNVLDQLNVYHEKDKIFSWSEGYIHTNSEGNKRYDFYIPSLNCIIETHGLQHYKESLRGRSLQEEKENDIYKESLAKENGITNYIVLDCRLSEPEYIKTSLLKSEIAKLFDLDKVDWLIAHGFACDTLIKQVCGLWESGIKDTLKISKIMNRSRTTITSYLKKGSEMGWCDYERLSYVNYLKKGKQVCQLREDGILTKEWNSIKEASFNLGINNTSIGRVCKGEYGYTRAGGFKWMYKEDYEKYIEDQKQLA